MTTVETTFKVNYPGGFFNLNCRPKKQFVDRTNLQYTSVAGLEDLLDTIDTMLKRNLKIMVLVWVIILVGAGVTIPLMIIYKLKNLWMSWFFPAFVIRSVTCSFENNLHIAVHVYWVQCIQDKRAGIGS